MALLARLKNWKTTLGGSVLGLAAAAIIHKIMTDAGCHFDEVVWGDVVAYAFTQLMGLLATDNGKVV